MAILKNHYIFPPCLFEHLFMLSSRLNKHFKLSPKLLRVLPMHTVTIHTNRKYSINFSLLYLDICLLEK